MSIKDFDKNFGINNTLDEEKIKFINRVEVSIFDLFSRAINETDYSWLFQNVCLELGLKSEPFKRPFHNTFPNLNHISKGDFYQTLRIVIALYINANIEERKFISDQIDIALSKSNIDLGINWKDGIFYKTGDKILDNELIDFSLSYLEKFPNEKLDLKRALDSYNSKSMYGVVENCFKVLEGFLRSILNNGKTLDKNKEDLLRLIDLSKQWKAIISNYLDYAHEYHRHAGENRNNLKEEEVGAFLYLTCLLVRTISENLERKF